MPRSVFKSGKTGRFVAKATVARHPKTTVRQDIGGQAKGFRSTITGRFVKPATANRHPNTTIRELQPAQ